MMVREKAEGGQGQLALLRVSKKRHPQRAPCSECSSLETGQAGVEIDSGLQGTQWLGQLLQELGFL